MDTPSYNVLLHKNITKTNKQVNLNVANSIELEAKSLSKKLQLDDRINTTARREAFITFKDHKPNFDNNPTCRLINPTKAEIGKISKRILDCINTKVVHTLQLNQWKNTKAVLNRNSKTIIPLAFVGYEILIYALIGRKPMVYQSINHRKSLVYFFSPQYL